MPKIVSLEFDDARGHNQVAHYDEYLRANTPWGNLESETGSDPRTFEELIEDYLFQYLDRDAGTYYTNIVSEDEKNRLEAMELRRR